MLGGEALEDAAIYPRGRGRERRQQGRAPGAGRKPRGEYPGKTETLTTRIRPETRKGLECAAAKHERSLSQEVETGLRFYLSALKLDRGRHIRALGEIVALLAQRIESKTGEHWNKDVFTGEALRRGIDVLVSHFAPGGTPVTPTRVKEAAAKMVGDAGEAYRSPIGLGETEAGHVMAWVEISNLRDFQEIGMVDAELRKKGGVYEGTEDSRFPDAWYLHQQLFADLKPGGKHLREK
jgi:hypothetical protein